MPGDPSQSPDPQRAERSWGCGDIINCAYVRKPLKKTQKGSVQSAKLLGDWSGAESGLREHREALCPSPYLALGIFHLSVPELHPLIINQ